MVVGARADLTENKVEFSADRKSIMFMDHSARSLSTKLGMMSASAVSLCTQNESTSIANLVGFREAENPVC